MKILPKYGNGYFAPRHLFASTAGSGDRRETQYAQRRDSSTPSGAPDELLPGSTADVTLNLMYWPEENYEEVAPNATFTLREGSHIVGFGEILTSCALPGKS